MTIRKAAVLSVIILICCACSTSAKFIIPDGTSLEIDGRPVTLAEDGTVTTRAFFWNAAAGVKYRLLKGEKEIEQGKVQSRFRPVSIFWPPPLIGLIFWPIGLNANLVYDLTEVRF